MPEVKVILIRIELKDNIKTFARAQYIGERVAADIMKEDSGINFEGITVRVSQEVKRAENL